MDKEFLQFLTHFSPYMALSVVIGISFLIRGWYKLRVKQWEMSLKHTMLERGMSAEEIKTVLEASTTDGEKKKG